MKDIVKVPKSAETEEKTILLKLLKKKRKELEKIYPMNYLKMGGTNYV